MAIGISGTREGCNSAQYTELEMILEDAFEVMGGVFLHGDCVGVDEEAHRIAERLGYFIEIFPPLNPKHRAFCKGDVMHEPEPYLDRNCAIVDASDAMLIVPEKAQTESPRSGTWYTYRYSLEVGRPTTLIIGGRFDHTPQPGCAVSLSTLAKFARWQLPASGQREVPPDSVH